MIWLTWRQFRLQAAVTAAALALFAAILAISGPGLVHLYQQYLSDCSQLHQCGNMPDPTTSADQGLQLAVAGILLVMPALIGIFWGAPLIARELETGTHRLGWTQSVSRRRWLWSKIAIVGVASGAVGGLLTFMGTWWYTPIEQASQNQFNAAIFSLRGLTPVGYALFAFALGLTFGVLIRRTLPAMASTLLAFVVTRVAVTEWVRPHLLSPKTMTLHLTAADAGNVGVSLGPQGVSVDPSAPNMADAWVYSGNLVNSAGQSPSQSFLNHACASLLKFKPMPVQLQRGPGFHVGVVRSAIPQQAQSAFHQCGVAVASKFNEVISLQPSNRFWPLQILETLLYVVGAALLLGLSAWWLRHRVA